MQNSLILANILGPLLVITAVGLLLNLKHYQRMAMEFAQNTALLYLAGWVVLASGLLILAFHNAWPADWTVLITIIGWLMLLKGIALLVFPGALARLAEAWSPKTGLIVVQALVILVVGAWLTFRGSVG